MQLRSTLLGWIVTGEINLTHRQNTVCNLTLNSLNDDVQKFWAVEECPPVKFRSPDLRACEEHYTKHTTRNPNGRYTVRLPFKHTTLTQLGSTYAAALKRFLTPERTLNKNTQRRAQYVKFLKEYGQLGDMSELTHDDRLGYYLPHDPVIKTDSLTTKIRVVFDAFARSTTGILLNDLLMKGPTIQDDLFAITNLRFRLHNRS